MDTIKKKACKILMEELRLTPENAQRWCEAILVKPQLVSFADMQKSAMKIRLKDILEIEEKFRHSSLDGVRAARDYFWKLLGLEKDLPRLTRASAGCIAEYGECEMAFRHAFRSDGAVIDPQLFYDPEVLNEESVGDVICITAHEAWHGWQSAQVAEFMMEMGRVPQVLSVIPSKCDRRMLYLVADFLAQKDRRIYAGSYSTNLKEKEAQMFLRLVMARICSFALDNKVSARLKRTVGSFEKPVNP